MDADEGAPPEIVGLFAGEAEFTNAVNALLAAGFPRADISVLSSHESLDVAGKPAQAWRDALLAMVGDLKYEGPLVASGAIFLAGGPVAASVAAVIGAAVGGIAAVEVMGEVTARPHTADFARAVESGAIVLWVCAESEDSQRRAAGILEEAGARNIHLVRRAIGASA
jgi:hypothetical protein